MEGGPCGCPMSGHLEDSVVVVGWDMEEGGGGEFYRRNKDEEFAGFYRSSEDHGIGVGGVAANIKVV